MQYVSAGPVPRSRVNATSVFAGISDQLFGCQKDTGVPPQISDNLAVELTLVGWVLGANIFQMFRLDKKG